MFRKILFLALAAGLVFTSFSGATPALAQDLRVADLPMPEGATDITYVKRRGDVRFQVAKDFKTVGEFYAKKLTEQRWTKSGRDNMQRDFQVQTFTKNNVSLVVRVESRGAGSEVRLTPQGMMWEEDDQPTPKDLPLPADAAGIEYEDFFESIKFTSPSNLKTVVAFLSTELVKRKWTKGDTEFDLENFVRLKFTQSKSSLDIDVRAEGTGCEVSIRAKGLQWDGMKAEIERSKLEKEKLAADTKLKQQAADKQAAMQKRKDRPKQGIEKLAKLPNEGSVVMNDKTHKLTHVIAYEVYENDEWSTKIVATQRAINQASLLAKLRKTGTDKDENENTQDWPQPFVQITLDENDRPWRLSLQADGTPGGATGDDLTGSALVEDGRARGTVALKEPGSFFDKVYTAEISFDVPVLTRDSTPAKRLTDAPKLANSGKLTIGNKTYQLTNVVSYAMKRFDESMTTVVLSEKPLNMAKLNASLGKKSADDYFEFIPQVQLYIDSDDNLNSISIWADNTSISGNSDLEGDIMIEDGRVRGTAHLTEPGEFRNSPYNFELSFDVNILGQGVAKPKKPAGGLAADSYEGLPIPEENGGTESEGSPFRKQTNTTVVAELKTVVDFYRSELASGEWGQWKENASNAKIDATTAKLAFAGPTGSLIVQLNVVGQETAIALVTRDARAAQAAGLLPAAGKARLVIANLSEKPAAININNREYQIAALAGAQDPKTGLNWEVVPGNYNLETKPAGKAGQLEKLKLAADETWGVIIDEDGSYLATQLY